MAALRTGAAVLIAAIDPIRPRYLLLACYRSACFLFAHGVSQAAVTCRNINIGLLPAKSVLVQVLPQRARRVHLSHHRIMHACPRSGTDVHHSARSNRRPTLAPVCINMRWAEQQLAKM